MHFIRKNARVPKHKLIKKTLSKLAKKVSDPLKFNSEAEQMKPPSKKREEIVIVHPSHIYDETELVTSTKKETCLRGIYSRSKFVANFTADEIIGSKKFDRREAKNQLADLFLNKQAFEDVMKPIENQILEKVEAELKTLIRILCTSKALSKTLLPNESSFVYRYRKELIQEPRMFIKVLKSINWDNSRQYADGMELIKKV